MRSAKKNANWITSAAAILIVLTLAGCGIFKDLAKDPAEKDTGGKADPTVSVSDATYVTPPEQTESETEKPATDEATAEETIPEETKPVETESKVTEPEETEPEVTEPETESETEPETEPVHQHEFRLVSKTEPTCTAEGYSVYRCDCGEEYKDDVTGALGHLFGDWTVTVPASCEKNGEQAHVCSRCGNKETQTVVSAGHTWDEGHVEFNPKNCSNEKVTSCTSCGKQARIVLDTAHVLAEYRSMYVHYFYCENCDLSFIDYYYQFGDLYVDGEPPAALSTDTIHLKNPIQTVKGDWSDRWKEFEHAVLNFSGSYRSSGGYPIYGLSKEEEETEEDFYRDYEQFRIAFANLYGWMPSTVVFEDNYFEMFMSCNKAEMFNAFQNGISGMSNAQRDQLTATLIRELLYEAGIYEGMPLYNGIGAIYDLIASRVQYDWYLGFHSAFYGLVGGSCVCDGYAEIIQRCCDEIGIPCQTIIGTYNGEGHAWNKVTFSDGTERFIDATMNTVDYRVLFPVDAISAYRY